MQATAERATGLRMGHLVAWIVGCAVGFAAYRSMMPPWLPDVTPLRSRVLVSCYGLFMGTAFGTILTGSGLVRASGYPVHPGGPQSGVVCAAWRS